MGSVLQVEVSLCLVGDVLRSNSSPHHPALDWLELGGVPGKMAGEIGGILREMSWGQLR